MGDPDNGSTPAGGRTSRVARELIAQWRAETDGDDKPIDVVREEHKTRRHAMRLLTLLLLVTLIGVFGYVGVPLLIDVPGFFRTSVDSAPVEVSP